MNTLKSPDRYNLRGYIAPALAFVALGLGGYGAVGYAKQAFPSDYPIPTKWEPTKLNCEGSAEVTLVEYNTGTVYDLMATRAATAGSATDPAAAVEEIRKMNSEPGAPFDPSSVSPSEEFNVPTVCRAQSATPQN